MPIFGGLATLETIEAAGGAKVRKFNLLAYTGGKAYIPGRSMPVVFDLQSMKLVDGMPVPLLLDHDNTQPVGHAESVKIGADQITATGYASAETEWRDRVVMSAANGFQWQLSVGVVVDRSNIVEIPEGRSENLNGQLLTGPFLLARHAELREITFTATGADAGGAVAKLAASLDTRESDTMKFSQYLVSLGLTVAMLGADALTAIRATWRAANPDAEDDVPAPTPATPSAPENATPPATPPAAPPATPPAAPPTLSQYEQDAAAQVQRVEQLTALNASLSPPPIEVSGQHTRSPTDGPLSGLSWKLCDADARRLRQSTRRISPIEMCCRHRSQSHSPTAWESDRITQFTNPATAGFH
jgi:hypothetical protein